MNKYDKLLTYLDKHGRVPYEVAMDLLMREYKHEPSAYRALKDLAKQKRIELVFDKSMQFVQPYIHPVHFKHKFEKPAEFDATLTDIAQVYRYVVRYGAQHYSTPGRANIKATVRAWLDQRRDLIQFLNLLVELLDGEDISHTEYRELEAGLREGGWYLSEGDVLASLEWFIKVLNPTLDGGVLGISKEDWESLLDPSSLRRINVE